MTKSEAITELVRIWHSPHLDLILKARLGEVIEAFKENNQSDSLVRDEVDACKESESKLDLISRQDAIEAIRKNVSKSETEDSLCFNLGLGVAEKEVESLPSAEPPYQYSEAYVNQLRGERDILQDMVNNMAEPKTGSVLCALADRTCPFQGKHFAWCLTCPHISEEDRKLVRKVASQSKTGEWIPVKWHEITDEEREREGYPKDWAVYLDCEMPCDEQEILVQTKTGYIRWDVCYEDGEYSLDSGWDWVEDIIAWMPLPTPYKGGDDE